jgi:Flp pilus assembly protein TadG
MSKLLKTVPLSLRARQMARQDEGVAAIEFAFIAPLAMALFIGAIEVSQAVLMDRRVNTVAGSIGDLVARFNFDQLSGQTESQAQAATASAINDMMKISSWLMKPYATTGLTINVKFVKTAAATVTKTAVLYDCTFDAGSNGFSCNSTCASASIPNGLVTANDAIVIADVKYDYRPLVLDYFMSADRRNEINPKNFGQNGPAYARGNVYQMKEKVYFKPRTNNAGTPNLCPALNT